MIQFRQKQFTEYDAMKSLYETIMRLTGGDRAHRFPIINKSGLISVLRGNNIVVEKFTISTSLFGKEKYRMYIKIGAKAKLPDEVRLPKVKVYEQKLCDLNLGFGGSINPKERLNSLIENRQGEIQKQFGGGKGNNNNGGGGGGQGKGLLSFGGNNRFFLTKEINDYLAKAIKYSKTERSLVLELSNIEDAIKALNILPFGLNYTIYLLDA